MSQREQQVIGSVGYQTAGEAYFDIPDFRPGIISIAIWFLHGLLYFAIPGRKTMVYSPEEEFAIQRSQHPGGTP